MKRTKLSALLFAALLFLCTACSGEALPDGMSETALFDAGLSVLRLLVDGDYAAVHELLREDQREAVSVEDIQTVVTAQLDDAGIYKQIEAHMATGQVIDGERYGVSVLYCEFAEKDVLVRLCFDADYTLVGFSIDRK